MSNPVNASISDALALDTLSSHGRLANSFFFFDNIFQPAPLARVENLLYGFFRTAVAFKTSRDQ